MNASWYLAVEGKNEGPFTRDQIAEQIRSGKIGGDTYAFTAGMPDWSPLGRIAEFQGELGGLGNILDGDGR